MGGFIILDEWRTNTDNPKHYARAHCNMTSSSVLAKTCYYDCGDGDFDDYSTRRSLKDTCSYPCCDVSVNAEVWPDELLNGTHGLNLPLIGVFKQKARSGSAFDVQMWVNTRWGGNASCVYEKKPLQMSSPPIFKLLPNMPSNGKKKQLTWILLISFGGASLILFILSFLQLFGGVFGKRVVHLVTCHDCFKSGYA